MRILEIILIASLLLGVLLLYLLGPRNKWARLAIAAAFCVLVAHVMLEGPHWQMGPAYLGAILLLVAAFNKNARPARWLAAACLILLPISLGFCYLLPMFKLPPPDGRFAVGTSVFYLTDPNRSEDPKNGGGKREVVVQAWYPSDCGHRHLAPYRQWKETTRLSSYQSLISTNSCEDGPLAANPASYPVIIFNPATNGRRTLSTFLTEELASQGFVIFALDHPYNSGPVELASGKVLSLPPKPSVPIGSPADIEARDKEVEKQTADTIFVLDTITRWNHDPSSIFNQHLDLDHIGALGHSLGGSVSAETSIYDARIRSVFDMSGPLFATARQKGVTVPFFCITEPPAAVKPTADGEKTRAAMKSNLEQHGGFYAVIAGANHSSFDDAPLFSPVPRFGGEIPTLAQRRFSIIRQYALAFFSQTLRSQPAPLLKEEPSPFPEVTFHYFTPAKSN